MPEDNNKPVNYAATEEVTDRKCPSCGGTMEYDPASGKLKCPYCGFEKDIEKPAEDGTEQPFVATENPFDSDAGATSTDWGVETKVVECKSCGAQVIYDVNAISNLCPYCGATLVMEAHDTTQKILAPGGVVPFKLDQKSASDKFKVWINGKFYCPKLAKDSAKPDKFQGLYVPYWTFDANTQSKYTGQYGIDRMVRLNNGKTMMKTDWYGTSGFVRKSYDDVLVCGSSRYDKNMLSGIAYYNTKAVYPYKPEYLAGYMAERYTIIMKDAWVKAQQTIDADLRNTAEQQIRSQRNANKAHVNSLNTDYSDITYKYLLLPMWISSFSYNGKIYNFMINGQTGAVSGKTPISWVKVAFTIVAAIIIFGLIYYMLGN